ncbi:ATPase [Bacillus massiliglaciei]|uniref:ATPase n=1 Tax=Bacillus massiliglaciei TaxID=1816693 RepID=UPI000A599A9C|nr:ATPase [Bacillus massiliglaciei]
MKIIFKALTLTNFKSHRDLTVEFGDTTQITADNAKGKTTVVESIPWLLYGTDATGSKLNPAPITYEAEETMVSLLLDIDEKSLLLGRGLKKGKTAYYINEVPSKAGEFNEIVENLFTKDLFLSLFNPHYFPSLHWEKQRATLLQYVSSPANKEVLKHMPDEQHKCLAALLKKHSLDDIKKIHAENKTSLDKKYIAAQSRTKTLKEQLDRFSDIQAPIESLKVELAQIDKQVREKENQMDDIWDKNQDFNKTQAEILNLQQQIEMSFERWQKIKTQVAQDTCDMCKQPLDEEAVSEVNAEIEQRKADHRKQHKELVSKRNELQEKLAGLEFIDPAVLREEIKKLDESGQPLRSAIREYAEFNRLQEETEQAKTDEKDTLKSLNESIFILDSVKAFKAKEAELQAEKVQALFDTLSVRLFEEQKNGELKNTFEIELDGKPYRTLSLSESIRAGLELRDVLSQQSDLVTPVVVDNAESITKFKEPIGQMILSRVVAGQELKIEGKDAE